MHIYPSDFNATAPYCTTLASDYMFAMSLNIIRGSWRVGVQNTYLEFHYANKAWPRLLGFWKERLKKTDIPFCNQLSILLKVFNTNFLMLLV